MMKFMKYRKILIVVACILIIGIIGVGALSRKEKSNLHNLVITEVLWNEYSISEEKSIEVALSKGEQIKMNIDSSEELTLEIVEEDKESIVIKTNKAMSIQKESQSGINLRSNDTDFRIKKDKSIKLSTLSTDAGAVYKIEYK